MARRLKKLTASPGRLEKLMARRGETPEQFDAMLRKQASSGGTKDLAALLAGGYVGNRAATAAVRSLPLRKLLMKAVISGPKRGLAAMLGATAIVGAGTGGGAVGLKKLLENRQG